MSYTVKNEMMNTDKNNPSILDMLKEEEIVVSCSFADIEEELTKLRDIREEYENKIELNKTKNNLKTYHTYIQEMEFNYKQLKGKIVVNVNGGGDNKLMVRLSSIEYLPLFTQGMGLVLPSHIDLERSYEKVDVKSTLYNGWTDVPSYQLNTEKWIWFQINGKRADITVIKETLSLVRRNITSPSGEMVYTNRGKSSSCWFPFPHRSQGQSISLDKYSRHNIYILSLGRFEYLDTAKALEQMKQKYTIVVEPFEFELYQDRMKGFEYGTVLSCETNFHELKEGSKHVRNWIHRLNIKNGSSHYWLLDDNMKGFYRHYKNQYCKILDGSCFYFLENLQQKFENVAICGMAYKSDTPAIDKKRSHLNVNSKVYSTFLIDVEKCSPLLDVSMNLWRGKYNEDIILCIDSLKKGLSTFNTSQYLCDKMTTGKRKGGNQKDLYKNGKGKGEGEVWNSKRKTDYLMETFKDLTEKNLIKYSNRRKKQFHHYVNWKKIEKLLKIKVLTK